MWQNNKNISSPTNEIIPLQIPFSTKLIFLRPCIFFFLLVLSFPFNTSFAVSSFIYIDFHFLFICSPPLSRISIVPATIRTIYRYLVLIYPSFDIIFNIYIHRVKCSWYPPYIILHQWKSRIFLIPLFFRCLPSMYFSVLLSKYKQITFLISVDGLWYSRSAGSVVGNSSFWSCVVCLFDRETVKDWSWTVL